MIEQRYHRATKAVDDLSELVKHLDELTEAGVKKFGYDKQFIYDHLDDSISFLYDNGFTCDMIKRRIKDCNFVIAKMSCENDMYGKLVIWKKTND